MKCHLNRMTAALLLALVMLTLPALTVQAAPASDRTVASEGADGAFDAGWLTLWERLVDGLAAVFGSSSGEGEPDGESDVTGGFDPDGFTLVPPIDGGNTTTVTGGFDPDG